MIEVDPETVSRYTGLTDKNGVKIFEGDIIASRYDDFASDNITIEIIVWKMNAWQVKSVKFDTSDWLMEDGVLMQSEVIGNIHDNPELMEEADHE